MQKTHCRIGQHVLRFVRRILIIAVRYGDGVAVSLPFLGVSSLNFGPLATAAFFLVRRPAPVWPQSLSLRDEPASPCFLCDAVYLIAVRYGDGVAVSLPFLGVS